MIRDLDAGRQSAVALHEPMAQRGETEVRSESPSYRNYLFVGAAFAATFVSSRMEVWNWSPSYKTRAVAPLEPIVRW